MATYVIDIDGTLCTQTQSQYLLATPYLSRISRVNELYREGHTIIVFTARGMGSSGGNSTTAEKKWRLTTEQQLSDWGLKYHELIFGKPAGDHYVDDKALDISDFFGNYY
jgi:hypothetical protein